MSVPKWSEKLALDMLPWLVFYFSPYFPQKCWFLMGFNSQKNFRGLQVSLCAHSQETFCMQKRVRMFENDPIIISFGRSSLFQLLESYIKNNNFLTFSYLKESLVATFSEKCAHISRNYLNEQGMGVVKWSENHKFLWLHFYIFLLEYHTQKL